jgi:hypothetical protein
MWARPHIRDEILCDRAAVISHEIKIMASYYTITANASRAQSFVNESAAMPGIKLGGAKLCTKYSK